MFTVYGSEGSGHNCSGINSRVKVQGLQLVPSLCLRMFASASGLGFVDVGFYR